jgi:hypothetical protein
LKPLWPANHRLQPTAAGAIMDAVQREEWKWVTSSNGTR